MFRNKKTVCGYQWRLWILQSLVGKKVHFSLFSDPTNFLLFLRGLFWVEITFIKVSFLFCALWWVLTTTCLMKKKVSNAKACIFQNSVQLLCPYSFQCLTFFLVSTSCNGLTFKCITYVVKTNDTASAKTKNLK